MRGQNARWVRQPASGEDRETGPTRATYQLTVRILCLSPSKRGEQTKSNRGNTSGTTAPTSERQPDRTASVAYIASVALPGRHADANWQQPSLIDAKSAPLSFFETVPRVPGGKLADEFITDEKAILYSGGTTSDRELEVEIWILFTLRDVP